MKASSGCTSAHRVAKQRTDQGLDQGSPQSLTTGDVRVPQMLLPVSQTQICSMSFQSPKEQVCMTEGLESFGKITAGSGHFLLKPQT